MRKKAGLLPGMELHAIKPSQISSDEITLKKVEEEQAEGTVTRYELDGLLGAFSA